MHSLITSDNNAAACTSFLTNVGPFRDIDALPAVVYYGNDESADSFATHCAYWAWHKSCHLKFNNSKLAKAKKTKQREQNTDEPDEKTLSKRHARHLTLKSEVFLQ